MNVIIILGSPNDEQGNLLDIAISRCNHALILIKKDISSKIICTGGFGEHFNTASTPHGVFAKNFLITHGVHDSSFLEIPKSSFTLEDATLSKPILEKYKFNKIILVTSDYHMKRAYLVFSNIFSHIKIEKAPSFTNLPKEELIKLAKHESKAIFREKKNLGI